MKKVKYKYMFIIFDFIDAYTIQEIRFHEN